MLDVEYQIADYLLHHKEGLYKKFKTVATPFEFKELIGIYREMLLDELREELIINLHFNYEDVCDIMTEEFCKRFLGDDFFEIGA